MDAARSMTSTWPQWRFDVDPPIELAETLAREIRREVLGDDALDAPFGDLNALAHAANARIEHADLDANHSGLQGLLAPRAGGFDIYVDPSVDLDVHDPDRAVGQDLQRHRTRFRVAHELAHIFFYDRDGDPPTRLLDDTCRQEEFCDRFAAALLVPDAAVRRAGCHPAAVLGAQRRYDVSLQLAVRRFAEVFPQQTFILMAEIGHHPPRVRAQWSHCPRPLRSRWWASRWLQRALHGEDEVQGSLPAEDGPVEVRGLALIERRQLLLTEPCATTWPNAG
jgi:hypothetical protein